ncbi:unnamed protein product, partial [Hapterophycus canaliculatus]
SVTTAQINKGGNELLEAGDIVAYVFEVDNSGNTCVQELAVSDLLLGSAISCDTVDTGGMSQLCPQAATATCSGDYVITQDDIDDGVIHNKGTVSCLDSE